MNDRTMSRVAVVLAVLLGLVVVLIVLTRGAGSTVVPDPELTASVSWP